MTIDVTNYLVGIKEGKMIQLKKIKITNQLSKFPETLLVIKFLVVKLVVLWLRPRKY